jgi:DNA-binding NtrC family response regulator
MALTFTNDDQSSSSTLETVVAHNWVIGKNPSMGKVARHVERAAEAACTVLLSGETGTGKEVWAKLMHKLGPRATKPFVPVNCAALTSTLAESQLFGHEKGAFTGAIGRSLGVFRAADSGVVFLDEVGEMPLELQPKLLRVLQQREVTPVGSSHPEPVDVQVIAATNRNLEDEVKKGRFREDLFYRLNMVELRLPPLRQRAEDIPEFMDFFSQQYSERYHRPRWTPSADQIKQFVEYSWPGNVRQLAQVIEHAYVLDCQPVLPQAELPSDEFTILPFVELERLRITAIRQALRTTHGHKGRAAQLLGVHANTLTRMLVELDDSTDRTLLTRSRGGRPSQRPR